MEKVFRDGFVEVNGVSTLVYTWGGWIEDKLQDDQKEVVIFFPGNPGILGYYAEFLTKLQSELCVPVWGVSFAGHAVPPKSTEQYLPPLRDFPHLYNLQGQTEHKIAFIEKFVPENVKITIVAHSLGSKMTLGVLKNSAVRPKVIRCYLLFPAIERLAESPNAVYMMRHLKYTANIFVLISRMFRLLPLFVRKLVISSCLMLVGIPRCYTSASLQYSHPTVMKNVIHLVFDKMEKVKELDHEAMKEFSDILFLYYGTIDGWVPVSYWQEMTKNHPEVKCALCERKIDHAFSLNQSEEMSIILSDLIKEHRTGNIDLQQRL